MVTLQISFPTLNTIKKLYFAFIDYEKAFDSLSLWQTGIRTYPDCYNNVLRTAGHDYYAARRPSPLSLSVYGHKGRWDAPSERDVTPSDCDQVGGDTPKSGWTPYVYTKLHKAILLAESHCKFRPRPH